MATNLDEFLKKFLDDAKGKYLQKLGIGHGKYVETLKIFEELSKIAKGLSEEVQSVDEFEKLKHHVVEIHPLATREISIWHWQIFKKLRRTPFVKTGWTILLIRDVPLKIFEHILSMCTANTSYCTVVTRTAKEDIVKFINVRKLVYLFKNIGISDRLKKTISNAGRAEVIVSDDKPFQLLYKKNREQLRISCFFGFWNYNGILQF